jgi:hypothetical protein
MSTKVLRLLMITGLLLGCSGIALKLNSAAAKQTGARVGQEFPLKAGQQLKLEDADLSLKFVGVKQDSRCPSNVNCVWAGNAEVALELVNGQCTTALTLNTHPRSPASDEGKAGGFRVKLVKLDPYPHTEQKIAPGDYRATLLVTRE